MEKKVIKFNLVGVIFALILIIAAIVTTVVLVNKPKEEKKENNNIEESKQIEAESEIEDEIIEDKTIKEGEEYNEVVQINGEEKEVKMKVCKGTLGYLMKCDLDNFFQEDVAEGKEVFSSLNSETVHIDITKDGSDFADRANDIIIEYNNNSEAGVENENEVTPVDLNGRNCYKVVKTLADEIVEDYYVDAGEGFYVIEVHCGANFKDMSMPIIEAMVNSFTICY